MPRLLVGEVMTEYWHVPGMMYPHWSIRDGNAHNDESDTDMGDLDEAEFHSFFPHAERIPIRIDGDR